MLMVPPGEPFTVSQNKNMLLFSTRSSSVTRRWSLSVLLPHFNFRILPPGPAFCCLEGFSITNGDRGFTVFKVIGVWLFESVDGNNRNESWCYGSLYGHLCPRGSACQGIFGPCVSNARNYQALGVFIVLVMRRILVMEEVYFCMIYDFSYDLMSPEIPQIKREIFTGLVISLLFISSFFRPIMIFLVSLSLSSSKLLLT